MKPLSVATVQPAATAASTALRMLAERPELRDSDHDVARACVQLDLLGEDAVVAEIVAETGEHAGVVEGERADPAVLGIVGRHVARDRGAAAVADEDQLVAGGVRRASAPP